MSRWREVSLGEICEFRYGKSLPAAKRDGGPVPVFGSNGIVGYHSRAITDGPTIVIGRKGSFGEVAFSGGPCWPIDTTYYVDGSSTSVDLVWLTRLLRTLGLTGMNRAAAIPGLNREDAYRKQVLVPPVEEQRRIAAILDQADAIRTKRRQVLDRVAELPERIYLENFGGMSAETTVESVAVREKGGIRTGPFGSQLLHSEFVDEGIAVLGLDNVVGNVFTWGERRYITEEKYDKLKRYTVRGGDVLISIMGTTGRCVVVPSDIPTAINTKHICAITPDVGRILPPLLRAAFLWHPESRAFLRRQTKGSIMDGLNMGIIKRMPVPEIPLDRQKEFAEILSATESRQGAVRRALTKDDELFASLQVRAFRGEL